MRALANLKMIFLKKYLLINIYYVNGLDRTDKFNELFDTRINFARDNINGVSERKKFRFQWYNDIFKRFFLKKKIKKVLELLKNEKKKIIRW